VVRHPLVAAIIDAYDQDPEAAQNPQRRAGADRAS